MSLKLTKEQISQLTPEQQDLLGQLALDREHETRQLKKELRQNWYDYLFPILVFIGIVFFWKAISNSSHTIWILGLALFLIIQLHVVTLHRRLNALIKLTQEKKIR